MAEWATAPGFLTLPASRNGDARENARSKLDRLFEIALFLLIVTGFIAVASSGALDGFSVALVALALLARGYLLAKRKAVSLPESWDIYISLGYVVFYVVDFFFGSRGFIPATVHLVLFSMVVKLFSIRRDRDYVYLAVLAFLQMLAACVLTVDATFVLVFAFFALLAVFTFVTFEMRRSWANHDSSAREQSSTSPAVTSEKRTIPDSHGKVAPKVAPRLAGSVVKFCLAMAVGILVLASGLFFVLPRVAGGYLSQLAPKSRIVSGFSEQVRLGQIGEIQQSSAVVMHVEVAEGARLPAGMYWRGVALSLFDGREWFNPLQRSAVRMNYPGRFNLGRTGDHWSPAGRDYAERLGNARMLRYRVLMEPIGTNVFFFAPFPVSVEGDYRALLVDSAGGVFNADAQRTIGTYVGVSDIGSPGAEQLRAAGQEYPAAISLTNLQLPPRLDRRIPELARKVTAGAATPYDRALAIERYLNSNFGYTLQLPKTETRDPLAQFLFERKEGHCEYFASAMAVMLRTIGIPSRVVNGFRGGELNDLTGSYMVRARDAHSWVEAYFPGSGWATFDPTPASSLSSPALSRLDLYMDAMREFWREWVINYDFSHQAAVGTSAALRGMEFSRRIDRWSRQLYFKMLVRGLDARTAVSRDSRRWAIGTAVFVAGLLLAFNAKRLRRAILLRRVEKRPAAMPDLAATLWYQRMLQVVGRRGWRKSPSQTPAEFLASLGDSHIRERVAEFTRCYLMARFGRSAEHATRLPELFGAVQMACRRRV